MRCPQVSPLQWPPTRMRRVLIHAFSDFISDEMLDAASAALDMGYEGSLSRYAAGPYNACTHVVQNQHAGWWGA